VILCGSSRALSWRRSTSGRWLQRRTVGDEHGAVAVEESGAPVIEEEAVVAAGGCEGGVSGVRHWAPEAKR
jgi:hypothetical protein